MSIPSGAVPETTNSTLVGAAGGCEKGADGEAAAADADAAAASDANDALAAGEVPVAVALLLHAAAMRAAAARAIGGASLRFIESLPLFARPRGRAPDEKDAATRAGVYA
jgi:hypothetical protein